MSDPTPENPSAAATPEKKSEPPASTASSAPAKPSRGKKWRRRLKLTFLTLLLLFGIFRIALQFMLPTVLRRTAASYGLAANYERHEMDLFGGDVGIWHLILAPIEGGKPLLKADYCRGDVSTWDLLRGRLVVRRLEAEGLDVQIERDAKGEIALLKKFTAVSTAPPKTAPKTAVNAPVKDIDLTSPFQLDAFRLDRVHAHFIDQSVSPALDAIVEVNLRLTDLRSPVRPSGFDLELSARPLLDSLRAKGVGRAAGKDLDAKMQVVISGMHLKPAEGYLRALGLKPVAHDLSVAFNWEVNTSAAKQPGALSAKVRLDDISVTADGEEVAGLDSLALNANTLDATFADIASIVIDGGHCMAERSSDGGMRVAGIELMPVTPLPAPQPTASVVSTSQPSTPLYLWNVGKLDLSHLRANFSDRAIRPAADLALSIKQLTLKDLTNDPARAKTPMELNATLMAAGIAKSIRIDGIASPLAEPQTADLSLRIEGLKPEALRPYLDAAGVECELSDGVFTCSLQGSMTKGSVNAQLKDVKFADRRELLALNEVHVAGLKLGGSDHRTHIDSIDIVGPSFSAERNASGHFSALGFHTKAVPARPLAQAAVASASSTGALENALALKPAPTSLPKLDIGRLSWKGIRIHYEDKDVTPNTSVAMDDAGVEITNLRLDADPKSPPTDPAHIRAWFKAPGLAGNVLVNGNIAPRADGSTVDLDVTGDGLTTEPIRTYLVASGIEPVLRDGTLRMHVNAKLKQNADGTVASVSSVKLSDLQLKDTTGELAGVDALSVEGFDLRPNATEVNKIKIEKPRLHLTREKDGTFLVAGIHTMPPLPPVAPDAPAVSSPSTKPTTLPAQAADSVASVTILHSLEVADAALQWTDNSAPRPVNLNATVSAQVDHFIYGGKPESANVKISAKADGCLDRLTITGRVSPSTDAPDAHLDIAAEGLRAGSLAVYLPPTLQATLKDGRFKTTLDAGMSPNAKGGVQGQLIVTALDYRDGAAGPALLHLDGASVKVGRYDPPGKVIAVEEISLSGVEADVRKSPEGMTLFGLATVSPSSAAPAVPVKAAKPEKPVVLAADPVQPAAPAAATNQDVARMVAANRLDIPLITVAKLNVGVRHVALTDTARPAAAPLALNDLELTSQKFEMGGADAENRPPVDLNLKCRPSPLADSLTLGAKIAPFAQRPSVKIDLAAVGIKGEQLLTAFPELKPKIDGAKLTDGRLKMEFKTEMKIDHRDLLRLDFSRPFDADMSLKGLEFRNADGPVLAAVEEFRSDGVHVEPKTGGMHAKSMEITNLVAGVVKEKDGIHALGLVLRAPVTQPAGPATTQLATTQLATTRAATTQLASTQPATTQSSTAMASTVKPATAPATTRPAGEIRLDALIVSGIDFRLEDRTVEPPLIVPITAMELEARDLSNYLLYDADKSMRFSVLINSGKVALPRAGKKSKAVAEASGDGKAQEATTQPIAETEERELFSQLTASGKLSLCPEPRGWVKTSLNGLELGALKGEARQAGFDLSGGTFDANIDARFLESGSLDLRPKFTFVDLGIAEPTKGPIERYFALPLSLDGAVGILQDASGQISIPLHVAVEQGKVDMGTVVGSAVGAVTGVVVTAVANAPLKAGLGVAALVGIDLKKKKIPPPPVAFGFEPAATALIEPNGGLSKELLERLKDDKTLEITLRHDLGAGDVKRAGQRANPGDNDALALLYQLRQKKMQLLKDRAQLAGQARGEMGSGLNADATVEHLRNVERELAVIEDGLDDLNERIRPGAGRQAMRRTRAACIAIGEQRLIAARDMLLAAGIPDLARRIHVTHAKFNPDDDIDGGRVMMTMTLKAR